MNRERLHKCILALLAAVEQFELPNGKQLVQRHMCAQYEYEITQYYAILRNDAPPGTRFSDTISVLLHHAQSDVPLAFDIHFVCDRIGELELYNMDSSQIIYDDYWDADCHIRPEIVCQLFAV